MVPAVPKDALYDVGRKFLADVELGDEKVRACIELFMAKSFEVGLMSKKVF
jgi:hypothetical protein